MKGRKPIPTALKVMKGTARKSRTRAEPKKKALLSLPAAPQEWAKPEQERFYKVVAMLQTNRLLDGVNIDLVYSYCIEMKNYLDAIEKIKKGGAVVVSPTSGEEKVSPWRRVQDMAFKNIMTIAREFGFTPSSNSRISTPEKTNDTNDEFDDV